MAHTIEVIQFMLNVPISKDHWVQVPIRNNFHEEYYGIYSTEKVSMDTRKSYNNSNI
jgi:hypothetical protein